MVILSSEHEDVYMLFLVVWTFVISIVCETLGIFWTPTRRLDSKDIKRVENLLFVGSVLFSIAGVLDLVNMWEESVLVVRVSIPMIMLNHVLTSVVFVQMLRAKLLYSMGIEAQP